MSVPLRFFAGLAAGLALSFGAYFGLLFWQLGAPTPMSFWSYDLNTRKHARAAAITEPKLLIVGGSGALFGINARLLERELGVPSVNLGTHAVLATAYILNLARKSARPGDTVLLVFEYELFANGDSNMNDWADPQFIDFLMARDPAYFRAMPMATQFNLAMRLSLERLKRGIKEKIHPTGMTVSTEYSPYDAKNVDEYGDMTGHSRGRIPAYAPRELETSGLLADGLPEAPSGMIEIRDFVIWATTNKVRVLASFPNLCAKPAYDTAKAEQTAAKITAFYTSCGVPVLGSYRDALLPRGDFFDTCYHLTEEAARERTRRFVPLLKPYFPPRR